MTYPKIKLVGWYNHQSDWQCRAKLPRRPPALVELRPNIFISLGQNNSEYPQKVSSAVLCWCCVLQLGHTTEEAARAVEAGKGSLALHYSLLTTHYSLLTTYYSLLTTQSPPVRAMTVFRLVLLLLGALLAMFGSDVIHLKGSSTLRYLQLEIDWLKDI